MQTCLLHCILDLCLARSLIAMVTVAFFGTRGIAQLPYILPPNLTVVQSASPPTTMRDFFFSALVGMLVVIIDKPCQQSKAMPVPCLSGLGGEQTLQCLIAFYGIVGRDSIETREAW